MTREQIQAQVPAELSTNTWLKEITLQLAQINEHFAPPVVQEAPAPVVEAPRPRRGRPPKVKHV